MNTNNAKFFRGTMMGIAAAGCMTAMPAAADEIDVSGSVAVSNLYLFRGADLGNGRGMVSGDLVASMAGFYGGIWGTSGDSSLGSEYDLFIGYGGEFDGISFDISVVNYVYPNSDDFDTFGSYSEIFLNVGFMGFGFDYQDNVAGYSGFEYYAFSYSMDKYSILLGLVDHEEPDSDTAFSNDPDSDAFGGNIAVDYTHLDISYQYNDNLSFTFSQVIQQDEVTVGDTKYEKNQEDDLYFVVNYSLPIE